MAQLTPIERKALDAFRTAIQAAKTMELIEGENQPAWRELRERLEREWYEVAGRLEL